MQPQELRKLVRKWTIPVFVITLMSALVAFGVSRSLTPTYSAQGNVLVLAGPQQSTTSSVTLSASQVTSTAAALITEPPLLQGVINEFHLSDTTDTLAKRVTATPERDTELVDVVVKDPDPKRAAQIDNRLMADFAAQITAQNEQRADQGGKALQDQITALTTTLSQQQGELAHEEQRNKDTTAIKAQIQANTALLSQLTTNYSSFKATQTQNLETVSVAAPATVPRTPSSPRVLLNTGLGALAGLLAALGLAALLQYLDQGLHTEDDVRQRLGLACVGIIPRYEVAGRGRAQSHKSRRSAEAAGEAYRRLRTNLIFSGLDGPLRSVVVTSARAGEGKSRTAANLAVALASSDQRVLLMDCDLRRPVLHRLFGRPPDFGLTDMLVSTNPAAEVGMNGEHATRYPNLALLTSGTIPPNPSELLASKRTQALLQTFQRQYDVLVIDTPPADVFGDAASLAAGVSAVMVVIEAGRTNVHQAERVIASIRKVGGTVVGVVLNKARQRDLGAYYYYGYKEPQSGKTAVSPTTTLIGGPGTAGPVPRAVPAGKGSSSANA